MIASANNSDLIVVDNEYSMLSAALKEYGEFLDTSITQYLGIIEDLWNKQQGEYVDAAYLYSRKLVKYQKAITGLCATATENCGSYIQEIDGADAALFSWE
jgi:hypothetical protein